MANTRQGPGTKTAGANSQAAVLVSPETKEQLLRQPPSKFHQGTNLSWPPNCLISTGRGRPPCGLKTALTRRPGPIAIVRARKIIARPGTRRGRWGAKSFTINAQMVQA